MPKAWLLRWNDKRIVLITLGFAVALFASDRFMGVAFDSGILVLAIPVVTATLLILGANIVATPGYFVVAFTFFFMWLVRYSSYGAPGLSKILVGFGAGVAIEVVWTGLRSLSGRMNGGKRSRKLLEKLTSPLAAGTGMGVLFLLTHLRRIIISPEAPGLGRSLIFILPIVVMLGTVGGLLGDTLYGMNRRTFRRLIIAAIMVMVVLYGSFVALLYTQQANILFVPSSEIYRTPEDVEWEYDDVTLNLGAEKTSAWYIPAQEQFKGVILFSHGNGGNISGLLESAGLFREMGYDVLLYDYGGFGESTGSPSEERCYEDIRAAWTYLTKDRGIAPEKIVLHGRSFGGGPTCQLATEVVPAGVIVESAFTSVAGLAQDLYPLIPVKLIIKFHFDNAAKIGRIQAPVLVVHSPDDALIAFDHGETLFERAAEPKSFLVISGGHGDGFWTSKEQYTNGIAQFLEPLLTPEHATVED